MIGRSFVIALFKVLTLLYYTLFLSFILVSYIGAYLT